MQQLTTGAGAEAKPGSVSPRHVKSRFVPNNAKRDLHIPANLSGRADAFRQRHYPQWTPDSHNLVYENTATRRERQRITNGEDMFPFPFTTWCGPSSWSTASGRSVRGDLTAQHCRHRVQARRRSSSHGQHASGPRDRLGATTPQPFKWHQRPFIISPTEEHRVHRAE